MFSFPEMVWDLLTGFVKEDWVADLGLDTLERANGHCERLTETVTDTLEEVDDLRPRIVVKYSQIVTRHSPECDAEIRRDRL